jgi:hypothetical protein
MPSQLTGREYPLATVAVDPAVVALPDPDAPSRAIRP